MSDTLVVASKVKMFIKKNSELSTSAAVMDVLTKIVEKECLKAIENAKRDNRKTVMDRDFHTSAGPSSHHPVL
jgi:histone H3/H4